MKLQYPLLEKIEIDNEEYSIDMSFDNVLRLIDMLGDDGLDDTDKITIGLEMLIGVQLEHDIQTLSDVFNSMFEQILVPKNDKDVQLDLEGNPMPSEDDNSKAQYCLNQDAELIYAGFMQEYGLDLFECAGSLHWDKFKALLSGLGDDTQFKKVIEIRTMDLPNGKGSNKEREHIQKLKRKYKLKSDVSEVSDNEED